MKRFLFLLLLTSYLFASADHEAIVLHNGGNQHNHHDILYPADQPDVYYDDDEIEIIIDGTGEATYYDVDIVSLSTFDTVLSTQVNGTYDTIDVSSLPDDNYQIVITSSLENVFIGYFTNY